MRRDEVRELHYITPITNVSSILRHGILSHNRARKLGISHDSVANPEVQEIRKNKKVPRGYTLHDYANLYFDAHNPMLSALREKNCEICVLAVSTEVLNLPEVVVADQNAARGPVRFCSVDEGLAIIDRDRVYAEFWIHQNPIEAMNRWRLKCSEVLVPNQIDKGYIQKAYVANEQAKAMFMDQGISLAVEINRGMFFRE